MPRMLTLATLLAATLLLPGRAAAEEECVCGVGQSLFGGESPFGGWEALLESTDPRLLMDRLVDPSELETPDPHAVRGVVPTEGAPQVLWCSHADDPRCSPLQPTDEPNPRALGSAPSVLPPPGSPSLLTERRWAVREITPVLASQECDTGRDHVSQPERPPRG